MSFLGPFFRSEWLFGGALEDPIWKHGFRDMFFSQFGRPLGSKKNMKIEKCRKQYKTPNNACCLRRVLVGPVKVAHRNNACVVSKLSSSFLYIVFWTICGTVVKNTNGPRGPFSCCQEEKMGLPALWTIRRPILFWAGKCVVCVCVACACGECHGQCVLMMCFALCL